VLLIEKEPFPFLLQRRCITRHVDPNLFDWPTAHWHKTVYPSQEGDSVDFAIEADEEPRQVARRWTAYLHAEAARAPRLDIRYRTKITHIDVMDNATKTHTVRFLDERTKTTDELQARMVILAEGPGEEKDTAKSTKKESFWGYRFWDTDPFDKETLRAQRILIAGSGDGALQDFLRMLIKPRTALRSLLEACAIPEEHLTSIQVLHEHNLAAFLWCADFRHEHENDLFVHRHHAAIVNDLFAKRRTRKLILRAVRAALRPHLPQVVLAHACEHFTHGYPLNRFLVLLVARAVRELGHKDIRIEPNTFVTAIDCGDHKTVKCPPGEEHRRRLRRYCYANDHTVYFAPGACYDTPPAHAATDRSASFDAIILRFGVKEKDHLPADFPRDREKPLRQLLPTHLAHQKLP